MKAFLRFLLGLNGAVLIRGLRFGFKEFIRADYAGLAAVYPFYNLFTQFGTCALGGFVFVWLGSLMTRKYRSFSVWIYATLGIAAALALADGSSIQGFAGQSAGAVIAATIFWQKES